MFPPIEDKKSLQVVNSVTPQEENSELVHTMRSKSEIIES